MYKYVQIQLNMAARGGGSKGSDLAVFGYFDPLNTIPIRARAYNDCVQDAVLLKTASK